jgi:hypothetical protein
MAAGESGMSCLSKYSRHPAERQRPFDTAVVMQTVGRPTLIQAVQSVFSQDIDGRIQILLGIDKWAGEDYSVLDEVRQQCPGHIDLVVLDLGYSTSGRHGGLYSNNYGGALRTILTYMANSRYVAYLDDDNWFAPNHLSTLLQAIQGKAWAFSRRHFVDAKSGNELCEDDWESMGPGQGVYAEIRGGFVDTSSFLIDKLACHHAIPAWSEAPYKGGVGEDRHFFSKVKDLPFGDTGLPTSYYRVVLTGQHPYLLWKFKCAGVNLARFLPPHAIPPESAWAECAAFDNARATLRTSGDKSNVPRSRMKLY